MRRFFAKRGVGVSAVAFAALLADNAIHASPAPLAAGLAAALSARRVALLGNPATAIAKATLKAMAWTNSTVLAFAAMAAASVLMTACVIGNISYQQGTNAASSSPNGRNTPGVSSQRNSPHALDKLAIQTNVAPNLAGISPDSVITDPNSDDTDDDNPVPFGATLENDPWHGSLRGRIVLDGSHQRNPKPIRQDQQAECGCTTVPDTSLVVDPQSHGIKWVIVRIMAEADTAKEGELPTPAKPPSITMRGCRFYPHILVVAPGTDIQVFNRESVNENIHTHPFDSNNPEENIGVPSSPNPMTYKGKWVAEPDLIQVNSDVHGAMKSFIVVHDPRLCAVTGKDGSFEIRHVREGKYQVVMFQESMDEKRMEVQINGGTTTDLGVVNFGKLRNGK